MKAKFEELEWVPIGSQIEMKSELCTWSEFYLPTTDFDAIWGSNRTHPILTDLGGKAFTSHTHFSNENWEWLRSVSNDVCKQSRLRPVPSAQRMVFVILHGRDLKSVKLQNEEIFSYALFNHLTANLESSDFARFKENNPDLEWCIPTKESYVNSPISYGKTEDHSVIEDIFPADKKSLVTGMDSTIEEFVSKLQIPTLNQSMRGFQHMPIS